MCGCLEGLKISEVHYWDIKECDLMTCPQCNLTQFDPMLTDEETALGCYAYYIQETMAESRHSQLRNCVRNYRRGVAFASRLKAKGIRPSRVLELGPGSGYFAAGMQFVFEQAEFTVLDVLDEVLDRIKAEHGFKTIKATPETIDTSACGRFDLVVARDIIEHVGDISKVTKNVLEILDDGGYFHFITPNGHEDAWAGFARWRLSAQPSEILINHVNYFDGRGLERFLNKLGFATVDFYNYGLKGTRRGRGWGLRDKNACTPSTRKSAASMVRQNEGKLRAFDVVKREVLNEWWLHPKLKSLAPWYCRFRDRCIIRLPVHLNVGHEIFALLQKK